MAREYFRVYNSYLPLILPLNDVERGQLFKALFIYSAYGIKPDFNDTLKQCFDEIAADIDYFAKRNHGYAGKHHWNWKGGITPKNQKGRASKEYADWRKAVFIRDDFTCQKCGIKGGKLNAHHIKTWATYPDLRYDVTNGITLCSKCHKELHKKMPNRVLKESICTSEEIEKLTAFQETFFYRLIVNCDDFGRFDARPKVLASRLFPLKEVRVSQIEDALRALTSAELVDLYTVDGKPFLQMKTWDKHQQKRAKNSKYPSIDDSLISSDINCNQVITNVPEKRETRNEKRETRNEKRECDIAPAARERVEYLTVVNLFNKICASLPEVKMITDKRKKAISARMKEINNDYTELQKIFETVEASDFLTGRSDKWQASFDWIFKAANWQKIREGNYANRKVPPKDTGRYAPTYNIDEIDSLMDAELRTDNTLSSNAQM